MGEGTAAVGRTYIRQTAQEQHIGGSDQPAQRTALHRMARICLHSLRWHMRGPFVDHQNPFFETWHRVSLATVDPRFTGGSDADDAVRVGEFRAYRPQN